MDYENLEKRISALEAELKLLKSQLNLGVPIDREPAPPPSKSFFKFKTSWKIPDWEMLLGGNLLGKTGFLAIILGFIWFIKLAIDNEWINESTRIFIGILSGFFFSSLSLYFSKKDMKIIPPAMFGTGFAILFLSILLDFKLYGLFSLTETFLYLTILSLILTLFSYVSGNEVLYGFGLLGTILSPVLMSTGENSYKFFFLYLTVFNILFLLINIKFNWKFAPWLFLLVNSTSFYGWSSKLYSSSFPIPFIYLIILEFIFLYREFKIIPGDSYKLSERLYFILSLIFVSFGIFALTEHFYPSFNAHIFLIQALILLFAISKYQTNSTGEVSHHSKSIINILIALSFLMVSLQIYFDGKLLSLGFVLIGLAVSFLGTRDERKFLSLFGVLYWIFAIMHLYFRNFNEQTNGYFLFNTRFLIFLFTGLVLFLVYKESQKTAHQFDKRFYLFSSISVVILGNFADIRYFVDDRYYRNLGYSYVLVFYALAFFIPGFLYSSLPLRKAGMLISILLISKLYLYDIWNMSLSVRIIALFSLGTGLVLTSIFFQKFKNKITGGSMIPFIFFFLGGYLISNSSLSAESFQKNSYHFYREILSEKPISEGYGILPLDREIQSRSGFYDIRIIKSGKQIPYIRRNKISAIGKSGESKVQILFNDSTEEKSIFLLKLPNLPEDSIYNQLYISNSDNFEASINYKSGDSTENLIHFNSASVFKYYDNQIQNGIKLSPKDMFVRLEITPPGDYNFDRITYMESRMPEEFKTEINPDDLDIKNNPDTNSTIIYVPNESNQPFSKIKFEFQEKSFSRSAIIYEWIHDGKEFNVKQTLSLTHKSDEYELNYPIKSSWKLEINNSDNQPLNLKKLTLIHPEEEIIFYISPNDINEGESMHLYYGNKYASIPVYDFNFSRESNSVPMQIFKLGDEIQNPDFSYSITEPPVSSWIIRGFFYLGLILLLFPSYRIWSRYK
ncbi:MAG: DUF2339 domain-containing protein [Leptospiraceae bacterium]|nr:DUF2339 domain-containing protein [Leptospiraceae bacterium]MCP5510619.1 DUF2339 domain-containing protein [Leptospiraceae bacterium]